MIFFCGYNHFTPIFKQTYTMFSLKNYLLCQQREESLLGGICLFFVIKKFIFLNKKKKLVFFEVKSSKTSFEQTKRQQQLLDVFIVDKMFLVFVKYQEMLPSFL